MNLVPQVYLENALPQPSTSNFATQLASLTKVAQKTAQVALINKLVRLTKAKQVCFLCKEQVSEEQMNQIVKDFHDSGELTSRNEIEEARKGL